MSFLSKHFGDMIRAHRKARRLTQAKLAEILEVEPPTVSRWEKGEFLPTDATIDAIPPALNVDPIEFLDPLNYRKTTEIGRIPQDVYERLQTADDFELDAIRAVLRLSDQRKTSNINPELLDAISKASDADQYAFLDYVQDILGSDETGGDRGAL